MNGERRLRGYLMGRFIGCSALAVAAVLAAPAANASAVEWPEATVSGRTDPSVVAPGQKLGIVWTIGNDQSERLTDVRLYSSVPGGWQAELPQGSGCAFSGSATTHFSCAVGDLGPGQNESIVIIAIVPEDAPSGPVEFVASAASAETPADAGAPVGRTTAAVTDRPDAVSYASGDSDSYTYTSTCSHQHTAGAFTSTCAYKPAPAGSR